VRLGIATVYVVFVTIALLEIVTGELVINVLDPPVRVHPVMAVPPTVTVKPLIVPTPITAKLISKDVRLVPPVGILITF
jgi:hypothetical protein